MNIKTKISLIFWGICASCYAQTPFTCHVKLDKPFHGKVIVAKIIDRLTGLDTLEVSGKDFTIKYNIQQAEEYRILSRPFTFDISVLAEPGCHYEISANGRENDITTVDGKEQNLYTKLLKQCAPIREEMNKVGKEYMKLKEAGKLKEAEEVLKANNALFEKENQTKLAFVKAHPNTLAGMKAASEYLSMSYKDMNDIKELLRDNPYKYTYSWRSFNSKYQELADKWIENKQAPDFTTTDINGKIVRLSDFRGKTVLLDFWASWCVPCRAKMKELRKVYDQLKERNITVLSISMDEKRSAWEKASKEDDVIWTNTCDLKPFRENSIGKAYKVTNVPQLFVISPEGVIATQNPSLKEILKTSPSKTTSKKHNSYSDAETIAL